MNNHQKKRLETENERLRDMCDELAKMCFDCTGSCPLDMYNFITGMPCEKDSDGCKDNENGECWKIYAKAQITAVEGTGGKEDL